MHGGGWVWEGQKKPPAAGRGQALRPPSNPGPGLARHLPGLLAGTADPVLLLLLVEAAALADAVLAVHDLPLGVEEGERWAAVDAEVL